MSYPFQVRSQEEYTNAYTRSVEDPEAFWSEVADSFLWRRKWNKALNWNFTEPRVSWFEGSFSECT